MKSLKEYIESDSLNEVKVDGINIPDSIEDKSLFKLMTWLAAAFKGM